VKQISRIIAGVVLLAGGLSGCHRSFDESFPASPPKSLTASSQPGLTETNSVSTTTAASPMDDKHKAATFEVSADPTLPYERSDVAIEASHAYSLPELIDLAQRTNPSTRIAWEQARQAAFGVGLVEATYLPQLSAEILGGFQHTPAPVPKAIDPKGNMMANSTEAVPALAVEWLLFDFGQRDAMAEAAKNMATAATVGFTGTHQKLIFEVAKAYFALDAERAQLRVAESALKSAQVLQDAAEAKYARGLGTSTEVATTRRGTAKALFDIEQAKAVDNDAYHALLEAMGLTPTLRLNIAASSGRSLPTHLAEDANTVIQRALVRRPDIVASLAKLRASEAGVRAAEASYSPKIGLAATAGETIATLGTNPSSFGGTGTPHTSVNEPIAGIMLKFSVPLFDGGLRNKTESIARSKRIAAEEELSKAQDEAVRQVARAYDTLKSTLAQHAAARAFVTAADTEAQSSLDAYRNGVGTLTVAATADTERTRAQSAEAHSYAAVLTAAAALAFTTGELTSSDVLERQY
jgi:outer membrane protein TolC